MPAESHRLRLGRLGRLGRHGQPSRPYLLTTATHQRQPVFTDFDLARLLVAELRAANEEGWVTSLAWVLMPDHLHWLVELHGHPLEKLMQRIKSNSSRRINRKRGHSGVLWQQGFHDRAIRREEDLLPVARYIVANPLRAGLVDRIGDYPLWDACWL